MQRGVKNVMSHSCSAQGETVFKSRRGHQVQCKKSKFIDATREKEKAREDWALFIDMGPDYFSRI